MVMNMTNPQATMTAASQERRNMLKSLWLGAVGLTALVALLFFAPAGPDNPRIGSVIEIYRR
jgi:hypothetical protein